MRYLGKIQFIVVVSFLAMLVAPLVIVVLTGVHGTAVVDEAAPVERPALSIQAWLEERFQNGIEQWFEKTMPFRGHLIRTDNQLAYWLFGEVRRESGTQVIIGTDGTLFEKVYIDALNRQIWSSDDHLEKEVQQLRKLQDEVAALGKAFLFVISPSKPALYPELVPPEWLNIHTDRQKTDYERIIPLLQQYGVQYFDAHAFFFARKTTAPYPLFSKSGTHWSEYGSCIATNALVRELGALLKKNVTRFSCESVSMDDEPKGADADLLGILNVWDGSPFIGKTPSVQVQLSGTAHPFRPTLFWIGTSFSWAPLELLDRWNILQKRDFYYYFTRYYGGKMRGDDPFVPVDPTQFSLQTLAPYDAVLIESHQASLGEIGFGFLDRVLK